MLQAVLAAIENAGEPVRIDQLSRQLGIEPAALQGMLAFWVRKGRLRRHPLPGETAAGAACSDGVCLLTCPGLAACPFVAALPPSYEALSRPARSPETTETDAPASPTDLFRPDFDSAPAEW